MCAWRPAWQEGRVGGEGDAIEVKEIYTKCRTAAAEHTPGTMPFSAWSLSPDHSPSHHVCRRKQARDEKGSQCGQGQSLALSLRLNHQARLKGIGVRDSSHLGAYVLAKQEPKAVHL